MGTQGKKVSLSGSLSNLIDAASFWVVTHSLVRPIRVSLVSLGAMGQMDRRYESHCVQLSIFSYGNKLHIQ